jgi:glucosamine-6-phosphate deaminase
MSNSSSSPSAGRKAPLCFPDAAEASRWVAAEVAALIRSRQQAGAELVLGFPTGVTPVGFFAELVRLHREEGLSFANVTTFTLDEYYGVAPQDTRSYRHYIRHHLAAHVDLRPERVLSVDGRVPSDQIARECAAYEAKIHAAGGIDLQLLGIGRNGHIGFNEPGTPRDSRTHLARIAESTRQDSAHEFGGADLVPQTAIAMGVASICAARRIILLAFGPRKAAVVQQAVEGPVTEQVPASVLQEHPDALFVLDAEAASALKSPPRMASLW